MTASKTARAYSASLLVAGWLATGLAGGWLIGWTGLLMVTGAVVTGALLVTLGFGRALLLGWAVLLGWALRLGFGAVLAAMMAAPGRLATLPGSSAKLIAVTPTAVNSRAATASPATGAVLAAMTSDFAMRPGNGEVKRADRPGSG